MTPYSANIHRLSPGDIWLPDNRASAMMVNDLAKQKVMTPASYLDHTTTTCSVASYSSASSEESSSTARRHRPDTASLKEYGECYKRLGSGTSAVVMAIRKLEDENGSERIYAIKQFRKKKKKESDKEYMKRLTSEFCISSTFSHPNVIHTMDLVLDEKKRYCTVMEYVSDFETNFFHVLTYF